MKVLFVCAGNAHRSPLAEALLKKMRPDIQVDSAGLRVAIPIATEIREYLTKHGAEAYLKKHPESFEAKRLEEYDLIVAMEDAHKTAVTAKCPNCQSKIAVWNVPDPYSMSSKDAEKVYEQIRTKVEQLARSI